jgi:peptidyl-prolyl cis-trans isomerase D
MAAKKGNRTFVWIVLILLFVGLLGFGTGNFNGVARSLGKVGDKEVSIAQYQRSLNEQLRAFEAQVQGPVTFQQAQAVGLDQAVLAQVVTERTLDNEMAGLGISIGDARVRDEVLKTPDFQNLQGNFDREAYRSILRRVGLSEAEFEDSIRDRISRTLLQASVVGGVPAPDVYADTLVQFVATTRDITWANVTAENLDAPLPGPTDADLKTYYDAHADEFTLPETRSITYAWLTPEMLQESIQIDEEDLRDLYQERIADFVRPERRLVERLVFADQAAADDARTRLDDGQVDFAALVAERGLDLSDIDLGDLAKEDLGAAGDGVFAAATGDVVGPFDSDLGPALFRVNAVLAAEETTFEDAAPDLRAELANERARSQIAAASEGINDLVAGGATLEDLVARSDLKLGTIAWRPDTAEGIAAYEAFRTQAAAVVVGAFPELHDLDDGGIFALRLDDVAAPTLQPFDDVRDAVATAWAAQTERTAIVARAQALADQIDPLTVFDTLGLVPTTSTAITRRSFVEGAPDGFVRTVFDMTVDEVRVIETPTGALIARVDAQAAPDPANAQTVAVRKQIADQAQASIAQDVFDAFAATVQARTDVSINQATLNAIHAQIQ